MIKFAELKDIVDEVVNQLSEIATKMKNYSKIDTDYRASALIDAINSKINQLNSVYYNVYAHPDFIDVYGANSNYDYTNYVKIIREEVVRFEGIYQKIKKFESVFGYYNNSSNFNNNGSEPEK